MYKTFPFCMILDLNNLLGAYYFQNLVLSCWTQPDPSPCCDMFHLSLPPWLPRKSHINSTKIPQTLSFLIVTFCHTATPFSTIPEAWVQAFRSPWIQISGMRKCQDLPRGERDSKLLSISVCQRALDSQIKRNLTFTVFQWCYSGDEKKSMNSKKFCF